MKKLILKNITAAMALTIGSYISVASATTTSSVTEVTGSLGAKASAVDVYHITCSKNTNGATALFKAHVKGTTAKGSPISVHVHKKLVAKATDKKSGDAVFSPYAELKNQGEGTYAISIDKTAARVENYVLQAYCETAKGKQTGQKKPVVVQNQ